MFLDSKWWDNIPGDSPFRDNVDGAINAATLRTFAQDVAQKGDAVEWYRYTPGPANLGAPYDWSDTGSETWWFQDSGSGMRTPGWSFISNANGQILFKADTSVPAVIVVQLSGTVVTSDVTAGTVIRPVLWTGNNTPTTAGAQMLGAPHPVVPSGTDVVGSVSVLLNNLGDNFITVGLMFVPPSGSSVQQTGGNFFMSLPEMETTVIAIPAATASAF